MHWKEQRKRHKADYKVKRARAILLLTETPEEKEICEEQEKYKARKDFLNSKMKHYTSDPCNFDRTDSEIFDTKKRLLEEGT